MFMRASAYTITSDMSSTEINRRIAAAKEATRNCSDAKKLVLEPVFAYAEESLTRNSYTLDKSRFKTYSDIVNAALLLDDLHFAYVASSILHKVYQGSSKLKNNAMPNADTALDALIAPMATQFRRAFLGIACAGFATLLSSRYAPIGMMAIIVGIVGYLTSTQLSYLRLENSLTNKNNRLLTNGHDATIHLDDGLNDIFAQFFNFGNGMLARGSQAIGRASQIGILGAPARVPALAQPQQQPAFQQEDSEQVRRPDHRRGY